MRTFFPPAESMTPSLARKVSDTPLSCDGAVGERNDIATVIAPMTAMTPANVIRLRLARSGRLAPDWNRFPLSAGRDDVGLRALVQELRHVALSLRDTLDLDGNRIDRVLELVHTAAALGPTARESRSRAPPTDLVQYDPEQHEQNGFPGDYRDGFLGERRHVPPLLGGFKLLHWRRRWGDDSRRHRGRNGVVGLQNLLLELDDALIERREPGEEAGARRRLGPVQLIGDFLATFSQRFELRRKLRPSSDERMYFVLAGRLRRGRGRRRLSRLCALRLWTRVEHRLVSGS